jgi:hypothetical protein
MRRLLAIVAFLAGGFAAEMAQPVNCAMIHTSEARTKRRKE